MIKTLMSTIFAITGNIIIAASRVVFLKSNSVAPAICVRPRIVA